MQAVFYNFTKRLNSTAIPADDGERLEITLKNGVSLLSPIFLLSSDDFGYNYCKFNDRYYWVNDIVAVRNGLYEVQCTVDVLATWKAEILSSNAFVQYSASDTNQNIKDARNVVTTVKERSATNVYPEEFDEGGSYILCTLAGSGSEVVSSSFTTMYGLTAGQLSAVAQEFNSEECYTQLSQYLDNPLQTVVFCRWIPTPIVSGPTRIVPIRFGTYEARENGTLIIDNYKTFSVKVAIPWQKQDFRAVEPYTSCSLYLPGVGETSLNLEVLKGINTITIIVTIDYACNSVHYALVDESSNMLATYTGSVGVDIPIASVQSGNVGGMISGLSTAFGGLATLAMGAATMNGGAVSGGASNVFSGSFAAASAAVSQNVKSSGTFGGGYNVKSGSMVIRLELIRSLSVQEPSDYVDLIGNPCMKARNMKGLTGFCKTSGFEVSGNMTGAEKTKINNLLDGGVYIE